MWNLLFSEYLKAKDCNGNQIRSDSIDNSRWVTTIADAMKRCEIEATLDGMVLESQDLNILSKYNILKNFVEGRKFLKVYFKSSPHYCKDHDHTTWKSVM